MVQRKPQKNIESKIILCVNCDSRTNEQVFLFLVKLLVSLC